MNDAEEQFLQVAPATVTSSQDDVISLLKLALLSSKNPPQDPDRMANIAAALLDEVLQFVISSNSWSSEFIWSSRTILTFVLFFILIILNGVKNKAWSKTFFIGQKTI